MMKKQLVAVLLIVVGCTTGQTPAPKAAAANPEYKNLQVLPRDITREQLLNVMRSFTRGLGVRCNHCHVVTATEPKEVLDFPADTKEEKKVARVMLRMVNEINGPWMARVAQAEGEAPAATSAPPPMRVVCWTCHRGKVEPEAPPPPEPR